MVTIAVRLEAVLARLFRHTLGRRFGPQELRAWLRDQRLSAPAPAEALALLQRTARNPRARAWESRGTRFLDPDGDCGVKNLKGFTRQVRAASQKVSWNEYGIIYRLREVAPAKFRVVRASAAKTSECVVARRKLLVSIGASEPEVVADGIRLQRRATFRAVIMNPVVGPSAAQWTFIYFHKFSDRGELYHDYPHYFAAGCKAAIKVILPTAPLQKQSCFKHWKVRSKRTGKWSPVKFNAWFNYLTDWCGRRENDVEFASLQVMRTYIHSLIRQEVRRVGDPRRVILGGASQGCSLALDAAMTYPEELGGVIGLIGHLLSSTPLEPAKRSMPLHLFHEASDKEMRWEWVSGSVQRLRAEGFNVVSRREKDPTGDGHWIGTIEGCWIRSALRQITGAERGVCG